jgi:hypothetical protein
VLLALVVVPRSQVAAVRILFCHESDGAAQHRQRAVTPALGLSRAGHTVHLSGHAWIPSEGPRSDGEVIRGRGPKRAILPRTDVAVLRLVDQDESAGITRAREHGQLVYMDLDDDVWQLPPWNSARQWLRRSGRLIEPRGLQVHRPGDPAGVDLDYLEANMRAATGVIVTTPALAESVRFRVPGVPVHICRNGIDPALYRWPRKPYEHHPLRVAVMGTTKSGNLIGLADIAETLGDVMREVGGVELWHLGAGHGEPLAKMLPGVPGPIREIPWAPTAQLPGMLEQVDVGIIARRAHPFHEAQSNVSGLTYMAAGVPFIASHTLEMTLTTGRVVMNTPAQWRRALEEMLPASAAEARFARGAYGRNALTAWDPRATASFYESVFLRDWGKR